MLIYNSFMPTKKCSEFLQNPQQFVRICKLHAQHLQFFGAESWHPENVTTPCVKSVALSQTLVWRAGSWWAWWVEVSWWVNCHWGWYSPCVRVCRRLAWSNNTPFYQCQPPRGTARQTDNSRQPSLRGCSSTHLEYTANWSLLLQIHCPPLSTVKTFLIQAIISSTDIIPLGPCSGCTT